MKRIICVGNAHVDQDAAGLQVYARLQQYALPNDVEVIDGGLGGLDLLQFVEKSERVVFVDHVEGWNTPDRVMVLSAADVAETATATYDHAAGLGYLLRVLPNVCDGTIPPIVVVGIQGTAQAREIEQAALLAMQLVSNGTSWRAIE